MEKGRGRGENDSKKDGKKGAETSQCTKLYMISAPLQPDPTTSKTEVHTPRLKLLLLIKNSGR